MNKVIDINSIDFEKEYNSISSKVKQVFVRYVNKEKRKVESGDYLKRNTSLKSSKITDNLVEDENGPIQIRDKKYVFPSNLYKIINEICFTAIDKRIEDLCKKLDKELIRKDYIEDKREFKMNYIDNLHAILSKLRRNKGNTNISKGYADFEEFEFSAIHGGILIACINFEKELSKANPLLV